MVILLSIYEKKYIGQNYNLVAQHQWQIMLYVFNVRAYVQFTRHNLISRIDSLKRKVKSREKKNKRKHNGRHSLNMDLVWTMWQNIGSNTQNSRNPRCDWCWRFTRRCWAIDVGGPSEPSDLNLNKPIEVDIYKTPPRKCPRRKINVEQISPQKLIPRTRATISPNVSGQKATQKIKWTDYEAEDNIFKGLEEITQTSIFIIKCSILKKNCVISSNPLNILSSAS
jgi:hypothetical protein